MSVAAVNAYDAFCTPLARDASPKALRLLEGSQRELLTHTQVLSLPPDALTRPASEIALVAHVWQPTHASERTRCVILAHGWEMSAGRMAAFVAPLRAHGFTVVALDMPAHGQSGGERTTMLDWAAALEQAVLRFGAYAVIGHSFGGMALAWLLGGAVMHTIERAVIIAGGTDVVFLAEQSQQVNAAPGRREALEQEFVTRMGRPMASFDAAARASASALPTLVVHDRSDTLVPFAHGERYAALIPGAQLFATTGLGHLSLLRDAAVVQRVVEFVTAS